MSDINKIDAFWQKCDENQKMSSYAHENGFQNVAASRYYYALFLAFNALFEKRGISVPEFILRDGKPKRNPYPDTWPKKELHFQAHSLLSEYEFDVKNMLQDAHTLRVRADYKALPVDYEEIKNIMERADILLKVIADEIKQNK